MTRTLRVGSLAAVLLLTSRAATGQTLPLITSGTMPECRFDSTVIQDTLDFTLFLTPPRSVPKARNEREHYTPYINAIASTFQQPRRVSVWFFPGGKFTGNMDAWSTVGPLEGEVEFRIRDGRVEEVSWWLVPDSREVMRSIEHAIYTADSLRLFPPARKLGGLPKATVRLALRLARWPPAIGGAAIGRIRLPVIDDTEPVEIIHQPRPHYPALPPELRAEGAVSLQFVVGENGLVPEETIRVLEAENHVFIASAVEAIARSRFRPATAGGCPIRQAVLQRVVFRR